VVCACGLYMWCDYVFGVSCVYVCGVFVCVMCVMCSVCGCAVLALT